jgi:2'-5' RNA ligase
MPRLFTGLEIPESVGRELALLRGGLFGARWIDEENYHVTLRFIGDVDDDIARDADDELRRIRRKPFCVTLDQLTTFGGDRPRALIARAQPNPALVDLQSENERVLRRAGLPPEPRKYVPHVTLARLRSVTSTAAADYLASRGLFTSLKFKVERFVLFSSRASTGGGPYIIEAEYPLE